MTVLHLPDMLFAWRDIIPSNTSPDSPMAKKAAFSSLLLILPLELDSLTLGEFLAATKGRCVPGKDPASKEEEKELALSDVEKDMARRMGISKNKMLKTQKANCN